MTPKSRLEEIKARLTVAKRDIDRYSDELSHNTFKDIAWLIFEVERLQKNILDKSFWESGPLALKVEDLEAKLQRQDEMLKVLADALEKYKLGRCFSVDGMLTTRFAKDALTKLKEMRGRDE